MKAFHYWALAAAEADLFFCLTEEWWRSVRFQNSLASQCLAAPREVEVERTFLSQSNTGIQLFREVWKTQMMNGTLGMTFPFNSVLERVNQVFLKYSTQNISSYFGFGGFQAQGLSAFCMEIQNKEGTESGSVSVTYIFSFSSTDRSKRFTTEKANLDPDDIRSRSASSVLFKDTSTLKGSNQEPSDYNLLRHKQAGCCKPLKYIDE